MTDQHCSYVNHKTLPLSCDVAVIGAGPAGLAVASALKQQGVASVIVIEREAQAGGIVKHCGHSPFGMREFKQILSGPKYAAKLVDKALNCGVELYLNTTVVSLGYGAKLTLSSPDGVQQIQAKRVIISTGVRETPRSARLVSGERPMGISTTGAVQSMWYLKKQVPFTQPVIIGSELVAFSALLTCRHGGVKPVAMIEHAAQITAPSICQFLPKLLGVKLHKNCQLVEIIGSQRVEAVKVCNHAGVEQTISCDGVLFTGQFTPESSLVRMSHLTIDHRSGAPVVDQFSRCSDPHYFAVGNVLHPVETAGWCWQEGVKLASFVKHSLEQAQAQASINNPKTIDIVIKCDQIKYVTPQCFSINQGLSGTDQLQLRANAHARGKLAVVQDGVTLWSKMTKLSIERRILIPIVVFEKSIKNQALEIHFWESTQC